MEKILGIDVGATGIKGNIVDSKKGIILSERKKIKTPTTSKPALVLDVFNQLIDHFDWKGKPVGVGFPAIIQHGKTQSASNIDDEWIGFPALNYLQKGTSCPMSIVNDADAAGIAEIEFGQGVEKKGTTLLLTLGTGIGSALFVDGVLVPNTELGHLKWKGKVFEKCASNKVREINSLSWKTWGEELDEGLAHIDFLFSPDMIILGGGISKHFDKYSEFLKSPKCQVLPAKMRNDAGIIGAAMSYARR